MGRSSTYADRDAGVRPNDPDVHPGERVRVRPADNAKDWVEGEVNFIDAHEVALVRDDADVSRVAVHFPRLGYDWRRVA